MSDQEIRLRCLELAYKIWDTNDRVDNLTKLESCADTLFNYTLKDKKKRIK
ncbi:MAG: hypothetical protein Q7W45_02965 [Bacteroidota bacterium]|nr:hypothetical protein [Bacteroidota bacterium]MDP3145784.1 hypothetical protein [Bacteroidota bacterium]